MGVCQMYCVLCSAWWGRSVIPAIRRSGVQCQPYPNSKNKNKEIKIGHGIIIRHLGGEARGPLNAQMSLFSQFYENQGYQVRSRLKNKK